MKRFYCTICERVKRVRVMPSNVIGLTYEDATKREGTCRFHATHGPRHPVHPPKLRNIKAKSAPTPPKAQEAPRKNRTQR